MPELLTAQETFAILAARLQDEPDDLRLSISKMVIPFPDKPLSIHNLPELQALMSISVGDVRRWAQKEQHNA